jgi:hypothetical protein
MQQYVSNSERNKVIEQTLISKKSDYRIYKSRKSLETTLQSHSKINIILEKYGRMCDYKRQVIGNIALEAI